jgi:hypothetical protein
MPPPRSLPASDLERLASLPNTQVTSPTPPSAAQRPFSNSYLYVYSNEHVLYELCQFYGILNVLSGESFQHWKIDTSQLVMISNTLVEGFALHFRTITDFLFPGVSPQSTDIVADDFCQPGVWCHNISTMPDSLVEARKRANKEIAHLASNRSQLNDSNRLWDYNQLSLEVTKILHLFRQKADVDKLGDQVFSFLDKL